MRAHQGGVGVRPAQVQAAVGGRLRVGVVVDQARERAREGRVVVDRHLVVRRAAPAAAVLEAARAHMQKRAPSGCRVLRRRQGDKPNAARMPEASSRVYTATTPSVCEPGQACELGCKRAGMSTCCSQEKPPAGSMRGLNRQQRARVVGLRPAHESAVGQELVGHVGVVEVVVLDLVALPARRVVDVRVVRPARRRVWRTTSIPPETPPSALGQGVPPLLNPCLQYLHPLHAHVPSQQVCSTGSPCTAFWLLSAACHLHAMFTHACSPIHSGPCLGLCQRRQRLRCHGRQEEQRHHTLELSRPPAPQEQQGVAAHALWKGVEGGQQGRSGTASGAMQTQAQRAHHLWKGVEGGCWPKPTTYERPPSPSM